ncbi:putative succinate dehydrogenase-like [Tropilaelaps mercedesae]|uniref:Succinate dehydrogenase [ubiquinone] cytochrome b small subunit n=1 Tax=Tropilaelaps mercedesae TaxID=418985 RepID=A0A1V9XIQ1_9ACAR|nr:putative succinate dehydrogenase-like [Tropilaelaps mercedesae]
MPSSAQRDRASGLIGIVPLALTMPNLATEFVLALSLTAHIHWGLEAIVVDYVRPRIVGKLLPKVAIGAIYVLSFATLGGLMYFNFTDVGLAHAVRILWKL